MTEKKRNASLQNFSLLHVGSQGAGNAESQIWLNLGVVNELLKNSKMGFGNVESYTVKMSNAAVCAADSLPSKLTDIKFKHNQNQNFMQA